MAPQASWPSSMPLGLQNHCLGFRAGVVVLYLMMMPQGAVGFWHPAVKWGSVFKQAPLWDGVNIHMLAFPHGVVDKDFTRALPETFDLHSSESFKENVKFIAENRGVGSAAHFDRLQQALGINYSLFGVLFDGDTEYDAIKHTLT